MADKVYPVTHTGITAELVRRSRRHVTSIVSTIFASIVLNDSSVAGATVKDALNTLSSSAGGGRGVYGDGSDGAATFDGSGPVSGFTRSGSVYTQGRDVFFTNITISSGVTVIPISYRIFWTGTLTNNGTISYDGNTSTGASGGAALGATGGTINGTAVGAVGGSGNTTNGTSPGNATTGLGGTGGAGGTGTPNAGRAGGTAGSSILAAVGQPRAVPWSVLGTVGSGGTGANSVLSLQGGGGGGCGGGDGTNSGGGGGGGGGIIVLCGYQFAGTGVIHARGGNGFSTGAGNTGGGGGGGGGAILITSSAISAGAIAGQTIDCNGGALGTGHGTGVNGSAGLAGSVILVPN